MVSYLVAIVMAILVIAAAYGVYSSITGTADNSLTESKENLVDDKKPLDIGYKRCYFSCGEKPQLSISPRLL